MRFLGQGECVWESQEWDEVGRMGAFWGGCKMGECRSGIIRMLIMSS